MIKNRIYLGICVMGILLVGCKEDKQGPVEADTDSFSISSDAWPGKIKMDAQVDSLLTDWTEFHALETSFDALYGVANTEDLKLVIADLITRQKELEASTYPEIFDSPRIKSRQKVFKTAFLKIKGELEYRLDTDSTTVQLISAYNDFRNQFNLVARNRLDQDLIILDLEGKHNSEDGKDTLR